MRLTNPWTGLPVEAQGEVAERLKAAGFKPEAQKKPRKPAPKKPKTTE